MKYSVSPDALGSVFMVPSVVAEKYLKLATPVQLKVLLYVFGNLSGGVNSSAAAEFLKIDVSEAEDALVFWAEAGILKSEESKSSPEPHAAPAAGLPSREDVIRRGMEDKNVTMLMREAQNYFGGFLSQNVSCFLLSLYDDCGMSVPLILFLLSYASSKGKCNLSFIRATSNSWIKAGVESVTDAEKEIADAARRELSWSVVQRTFGIEKRKPSEKESTLSDKWVNEWQYSPELLKMAYDECVDKKSKFIFSYVAAVLEAWHKDGVKSPEDIKGTEKKKNDSADKYGYGGYDINKFEEMLNKDD